MQVYKACFKIIKQNLSAIAIYVGIFLCITVILTCFNAEQSSPGFFDTKSNIAFINDDQDTALAQGLQDFLQQNANIISIADDQESLQDALFFRKIDYIVRIPAGFSESFWKQQNNIQIEKTSVENSLSSVHLDFLINRYLKTVSLYAENVRDLSDVELLGYVKNDLAQQSKVEMKSYGQQADHKSAVYYTYLVYAMLGIIFVGVTSIMMVFNNPELRRRNLGSPLKPIRLNLQLLLGNLSFATIVWLIMVALGFFINGKPAYSLTNLLLCLNLLCLTFVCLSLSFLIAIFIQSKYAQQAIANVLSLGLCFISGVFVPQQLLGKTINLMASFTPTYWYVKAVNDIEKLQVINHVNL
ncbi:MAG: ABC transporter permease, partial [Syntrophomonadaceae bacterium]|nr:ABC transporter permease [Syntrophomonadaceae bacterium]